MRKMTWRALAASALLALANAPVLAETGGSRATREFVQASAQSDTFEILAATSLLALSKDPNVRSFAQHMITAHTQTRARLLAIVQQDGVASPAPGISNDQAQFLAALQSQHGERVDRVYVRQQNLVHRGALATVQRYAAGGDDGTLRKMAFDNQTLILDHLRMADALERSQPAE